MEEFLTNSVLRLWQDLLVSLTLVLGLLLDLLERVEPLADAVDVEVLEPEVLPLLQVQVVEHALKQLPPQARPLQEKRGRNSVYPEVVSRPKSP